MNLKNYLVFPFWQLRLLIDAVIGEGNLLLDIRLGGVLCAVLMKSH